MVEELEYMLTLKLCVHSSTLHMAMTLTTHKMFRLSEEDVKRTAIAA